MCAEAAAVDDLRHRWMSTDADAVHATMKSASESALMPLITMHEVLQISWFRFSYL